MLIIFWILLLNLLIKPFWILGIEVGVQNAVSTSEYGIYITLFNLLVWTHGYMVMKGQRDFSAFLSALKNPSVIAVVIGLIFYLTNIRLPSVPASSLELVASINTPLAMLIAGATASQTNFLKAMKNSGIYIVSGMKLIAVPALCY